MKNSTRLLGQFFGLILILTTSSCDYLKDGEYQGNLTQRVDSRSEMIPVHITLKRDGRLIQVEVCGEDKKTITNLSLKFPKFSVVKPKTFKVSIPMLSDKPFRLKKNNQCFTSHGDIRVDVCFERDGFFVTALDKNDRPIFVLTADPLNSREMEPLEENVTIHLKDAIHMALKRNFKNRIEIEHVFQAKKGAEEAYKNLAPHIGMKTAISLLESSSGNPTSLVLGLLSAVGDLAPFLLPNRWFQAKEADSVARAQDLSLVLMELNLIAQVEGLAYIFERDRKNLLILDQTIEWLGEKARIVQKLEDDQEMPGGSAETLQEIAFDLEAHRSSLAESVEIDRMAFSNTLGYLNPEAIDFIDFDEDEPRIETATEWLDKEKLAQMAIDQSYEIKQLNFLTLAAVDQKKSVDWAFLDPQNGDSRANIGWASKPRAEVGTSRIEELQIAQAEVLGLIRKKVYETVFSYNRAIREERTEGVSIVKLADRLSKMIDCGIKDQKFNQHDLEGAIHAFLSKAFSRQTRLAKFRIAKSKIDRFQYTGVFQRSVEKYLNAIQKNEHLDPEHLDD